MDTPETPGPADTPDPAAQAEARTGRHRQRLDWRSTIAGFLLGVLGLGVAINLTSDRGGIPALTVITGLGAVFGIADWLRRYPNSDLQKITQWLLWTLAGAGSITAALLTGLAAAWLTLATAGLLAVTVLITTSLYTAAKLLAGAAAIGFGVAGAVNGLSVLRGGDALAGVAAIGFGVAAAVLGLSVLRKGGVGARWRAWWARYTADQRRTGEPEDHGAK